MSMAVTGVLATGSCSRDVRLAGREVREVKVRPVTQYGMVLDEQATPEQVVHVLLRAIREDFLARTQEERQAALDKQFDICAGNVIEARNRSGLSAEEFVYNVVYRWTPTASHYVSNFETDWEKAQKRYVRTETKRPATSAGDVPECEVRIQLDDPSGDPNARVVMIVWLAKDSGLWRVLHLGFDPTTRSIGEQEHAERPAP